MFPLNNLHKILALLLGAQLLLALALTFGGKTFGTIATDAPLLAFDIGKVDELNITASQGEKLRIVRQGERWVLPGLDQFPADAGRIGNLLNELGRLRTRNPLSTSTETARRFKVDAQNFAHQVQLSAGGQALPALYFGDSAGYKRIYARRGDAPAIYEIALAGHLISTQQRDWIDHNLLQMAPEKLIAAGINDLQLRKDGEQWSWADGSQPVPDQEKTRNQLRQLAQLRISELLTQDTPAQFHTDSPLLTIKLESREPALQRTLIVVKPEGDKDAGDYLVKTSDLPWYFKMATYTVEPLLNLNRQAFLPSAEPSPPAMTPPVAQ